MSALKGGEDPHSRRRLMHALIAVQVAFCFLVLFVAGLFVATFERLSDQPTGFSADRLLTLETVARRPQSPVFWDQVAEHLRAVPGVETVALAGGALLGGWSWNNFVSVNGAPPNGVAGVLAAGLARMDRRHEDSTRRRQRLPRRRHISGRLRSSTRHSRRRTSTVRIPSESLSRWCSAEGRVFALRSWAWWGM